MNDNPIPPFLHSHPFPAFSTSKLKIVEKKNGGTTSWNQATRDRRPDPWCSACWRSPGPLFSSPNHGWPWEFTHFWDHWMEMVDNGSTQSSTGFPFFIEQFAMENDPYVDDLFINNGYSPWLRWITMASDHWTFIDLPAIYHSNETSPSYMFSLKDMQ